MTHDYIKPMSFYDNVSKQFQVYSHTFGWRPVPVNEDGYIASFDKKIMKANPNKNSN